MLLELHIENFAIIQKLDLKFRPGLTTFTGETGAGKSILLDAIEALVGGKVDATMVRTEAERANLEAIFSIPKKNRESILAILERENLMEDGTTIILTREIRREGRHLSRVSGRNVSVAILKELGNFLVDIHGQSEHLSLLTVRQHLNLLDRYANTEKDLLEYRKVFHNLKDIQRELSELRRSEKDAARMSDLLNYQIQEIDAAQIKPGEEAELRRELSRLANAEKLASLAKQAYTRLDENTPDSQAITDLMGEVVQAVNALAVIDQSMKELAAQVQSLAALAGDISREVHEYMDGIEYSPRRLEQVEERLALLNNLKRKYGEDEETILDFAKKAREQLETITHAEERIHELEELEKSVKGDLSEKAIHLSQLRQQAAQALGQAVEGELDDLRMAGARFAVDMKMITDEEGLPISDGQQVSYDDSGIDHVEFLIAPNPGEGLKPLVKIASGGETSRLMLALKNVLARADTIPVLIFDEIDQGIGGRVGTTVGEKLWQLGHEHQVFCVTHLPQLAAYGNQHYRVFKKVAAGRTLTYVDNLDKSGRIEELANMLGGESDINRNAARETLESAQARKKAL